MDENSSDHFISIYRSRAGEYHRLIAAEDADGNLLPTLRDVADPKGKRVLDLGTGTGRIPLLLESLAGQVVGLDLQRAMLAENRRQREIARGHWGLIQADMATLPFPPRSFDLVTAGWAIGHLTAWQGPDWKTPVQRILREIERVLTRGGAAVILETLGTGTSTSGAPTPELEDYYRWLERERGFHKMSIRTDYVFASVEEAVLKTEFFFGPALSEKIRAYQWRRVPEWTGVWFKV